MPQVVYCDLERLPGDPGFERFFSSPGNMRQFVAFDVFLRHPVTDNYRYIGFTDTLTEVGTDFNIADGIFTVPVTGKEVPYFNLAAVIKIKMMIAILKDLNDRCLHVQCPCFTSEEQTSEYSAPP